MYGDEIRWRRENANMTQCELAEKVGVSQAAIAKYETSALSPNMTVAVKLAQILGTTCEELCGLGKYVKEENTNGRKVENPG
jgi:transcriptional regulator with XRE-family HTH domain